MITEFNKFIKRFTNTNLDKIDIEKVFIQPEFSPNMKPNGFWYSIGGEWLKWMKNADFGNKKKYNIEIYLNESDIVIIKDFSDLEKFQEKYKNSSDKELFVGIETINWIDVSKDYKGFEIQNYKNIKNDINSNLLKYMHKYMWFNFFDVSSGCLWDLSCVESYEIKNK
jgi:hypothetical protein